MVKVSVALAAYNGGKYLKEELDSILPQLGSGDEVVISDDGSTDNTIPLIQAYMEQDKRICMIQGPGRGTKQNIANAIAHTTGDYIFLADQDDVWAPQKVERVLKAFQKEECQVVVHDCVVTGADLKKVLYPSFFDYRGRGAGFWSNIWRNKYIGCCMAFASPLKSKILPIPDDIQMHDQWIGLLNDKYRGGCVFLEEKLLYYRRHGDNVSDFGHNSIPVMIRNRLLLLKRLYGR